MANEKDTVRRRRRLSSADGPARRKRTVSSADEPVRRKRAASSADEPARRKRAASSANEPVRRKRAASSADEPVRKKRAASSAGRRRSAQSADSSVRRRRSAGRAADPDRRERSAAAGKKKQRKKTSPSFFFTPSVLIPAAVKWILFALVLFSIVRMTAVKTLSRTPFETMSETVQSAADLSNTDEGDNQIIKRLYGLNPGDYDGILLRCPKTNMGAEELLLVRLKGISQEKAVTDIINTRVETQKNSFKGYGVNQTELLENSIVEADGGFVLFYSGKDPQKVRSAFRSAL